MRFSTRSRGEGERLSPWLGGVMLAPPTLPPTFKIWSPAMEDVTKREVETHLCDATGCEQPAIDSYVELREVPWWRHPVDELDFRKYEHGTRVYFCADHTQAAMRHARS